MEVVTSRGGSGAGVLDLPFQRRNVEEWSRMDRATGILEHARVETDHWAANTAHSSHKYGKVVDSRARNLADGSVQQRQRKQLEVFQAQVPGGSLQVIRTQSVTTSTTHNDFENLQLALNPLDLSSQKTKVSVGRSGSIGGRRPPSRPRSLIGKAGSSTFGEDRAFISEKDEVDLRLSEVARICQKVHEEAKNGNENVNGNVSSNDIRKITAENVKEYECFPLEKSSDLKSKVENNSISNGCFHVNISRKKSCSTEDLQENDNETDDEIWKRTSKVRRSLQFPPSKNVNLDVIPAGNVSKLRKELEDRKRFLVTRDISTISNAYDISVQTETNDDANLKHQSMEDDVKIERHPKEMKNSAGGSSSKRNSFVTVESLKEVRGRLRRLNSPPLNIEHKEKCPGARDDSDDGIATEDLNKTAANMKPYVYGADTVASRKFLGLGTGSLESRISSRTVNTGNSRSEEWRNRRKSYGFEPVDQEVNADNLEKTNAESSTDSGICRSSETVGSSSWSRLVHKDKYDESNSHLKTSHTIQIKNVDSERTEACTKMKGTVVKLGNSDGSLSQISLKPGQQIHERSKSHQENCHAVANDFVLNKRSGPPSEPTSIMIPILPELDNKNVYSSNAPKSLAERRELLLKHSPWMNNTASSEVKRHSIAVDETKYVREGNKRYVNSNESRRHSYFENDHAKQYNYSLPGTVNLKKDDLLLQSGAAFGEGEEGYNKKQKKVEFCKTEVHFAAEPGRFNIVETDEKPPPTNMFRRRKRINNNICQIQAGLPEIRFGDSLYEKKLLGGTETSVHHIEIKLNIPTQIKDNENIVPLAQDVFQDDADREDIVSTQANATIIASANQDRPEIEDSNESDIQTLLSKDQSSLKPRSILKNNRKLRQFHLGEYEDKIMQDSNTSETLNTEDSESRWGVRLRPIQNSASSSPMWRSTVTLQNNSNASNEEEPLSSESELQKLLRSLKPATQRNAVADYCKSVPGVEVKVVSAAAASRSPGWSVADRVKQAEDQKYGENKGYSTRVNFGAGEATVVTEEQKGTKNSSSPLYQQNDHPKPTWLRREERKQQDMREKKTSDKAHSVDIGENYKRSQSSHREETGNSATPKKTTTITIDLSPTPSNADENVLLPSIIQEAERRMQDSSGGLLSPSLIMKTIHLPKRMQQETESNGDNTYVDSIVQQKGYQEPEENFTTSDIQDIWNNFTSKAIKDSNEKVYKKEAAVSSQLAALRELYYSMELSDDSEKADEEVCAYMNTSDKYEEKERMGKENEDNSSVVSGSWSRMRAFRNISRFANKKETSVFTDQPAHLQHNIKTTATAKLDNYGNSGRLQTVETLVSTRSGHPKITSISLHYEGDSSTNHERINIVPDKQLRSEKIKSPHVFDTRTYENIKPRFEDEKKINYQNSEEPSISLSREKFLSSEHSKKHYFSVENTVCDKTLKESCSAAYRPQITSNNIHNKPKTVEPSAKKTSVNSDTYSKSHSKKISLHQYQTATPPEANPYANAEQSNPNAGIRKSRMDYKVQRKCERSNIVAEKNLHNKAPIISRSRHISLERILKENGTEERATKNINLHDKEKTGYNLSQRKSERSVSPSKKSASCILALSDSVPENKSASSSEMPIYQNLENFSKKGLQRSDTESTILEELTRAADEILQAVNGFTDEDSYKASSDNDMNMDDENRYHKGRKISRKEPASLGTISEMPMQSSRRVSDKGNSTAKMQKQQQVMTKRQVRPTSSTSSLESLTKRLQEPCRKKTVNSVGTRASNRTARLLQRASSRELLLHASSSEDVTSGAESRKPRLTRRSKTTTNKTDISSTTKVSKISSTAQQMETTGKTSGERRKITDINKPKERFPGSNNKQSQSVWKGSSTVTAASRSHVSHVKDEERRRKESSKLTSKTRTLRHKSDGSARTPRTNSQEKRTEDHIRSGSRSFSSACVVTKKKPTLVSSHKEGDVQAVSKI